MDMQNVREASSRARKLVSEGAVLLDVRTPDEYRTGHLAGARNIPVQELPRRVDEVGSRDVPVVVYCMSGMRGASAAEILRRAGFKEVLNLGPMAAW